MKKTAISLLLAVTMVFSLVLVAAPAAQAAEHTNHCVCGGSCTVGGHTHSTNVTWTEWTDAANLPTETGNYYLGTNVTVGEKVQPNDGAKIVLCLNGKSVNSTASGIFYFKENGNITLTITDCTGTGTMTSKGAADKNGGLVWVDGANNVELVINVYAGTLTAPANSKSGGVMYLNSNTTLNIYGGTMIGGTVADRGGVLNVSQGGKVNMYGGLLKGGKNEQADEAKGGGTIRIGGNNSGAYKSVFNMYGGTIEGGESAYGAAIYVQSPKCELNLMGGTIKSGTGTVGKDIYVTNAATVNVKKLDAATTIVIGKDADPTKYTEGDIAPKAVLASDASVELVEGKDANNNKMYEVKLKTAPAPGGSTPSTPSNPATGDSANLVAMGLGLVLGVAGMACLLPKKQNV